MWASALRANRVDISNFKFYKLAEKFFQNGREVVQSVLQKGKVVPRAKELPKLHETSKPFETIPSSFRAPPFQHKVFNGLFARSNLQSVAAELRRRTAVRLTSGLRDGRNANLPLFAFVGLGLAVNQNFGKDHEREEVCDEIRNLFKFSFEGKTGREEMGNYQHQPVALSLETLRFGQMLDQGCNAAIYEAELLHDTDNNLTTESTSEVASDASAAANLDEADDSDAPSDDTASTASDDSDITVLDDIDVAVSDGTGVMDDAASTASNDGDLVVISDTEAPMSLGSDVVIIDRAEDWHLEMIESQNPYIIVEPGSSGAVAVGSDADSDILVLDGDGPSLSSEAVPTVDAVAVEEGEGTEAGVDSGGNQRCRLAVKMMFNYDVESNAEAIYRAMAKEAVPVQGADAQNLNCWHNRNRARMKSLPQHPNIVEMLGLFVDDMPDFVKTDGLDRYPAALPRRLHQEGFGRNMTMFLVMKRYNCNLHQLLTSSNLDLGKRLLLLTQLVEGVAHMAASGIAHRDLKTDNLFVDTDTFQGDPWLAIGDFGCCLAEGDLVVPYYTGEVSKGGNAALMAPEIATAEPGWGATLDYGHSDLWAVGALAYEILGGQNPFYRGGLPGGTGRLDSRTYSHEQLPPLPPNTPPVVARLVLAMLERDPEKRPSPDVAATVLQLFLAGCPWLQGQGQAKVTESQLLSWTVTYAACQALQPVQEGAQSLLTHSLLSRLSYASLKGTARFLQAV